MFRNFVVLGFATVSILAIPAFADIPFTIECDNAAVCAKFGPSCEIVKLKASATLVGGGAIQGTVDDFTTDGKIFEFIQPNEPLNGSIADKGGRTYLALDTRSGRQRLRVEMDIPIAKDMFQAPPSGTTYGPVDALVAGPMSGTFYPSTCTLKLG